MVVVHRIHEAIGPQSSPTICPGALQAASLPHQLSLKAKAIGLPCHVLKYQRALIWEERQKVPDWHVRLIGPQEIPSSGIQRLHILVGGALRRVSRPIGCSEQNSFVDHVEAVVLASGFGHIGVPYPFPIFHVKGSHSALRVADVHHPLVDHRRVHEICRHATVLPQQIAVFVKLAHGIRTSEVDVQVIVNGCSVGQCMKSSLGMMPRPCQGVIHMKWGVVLGHREEREAPAPTGPVVLFFPLAMVSCLQEDVAGRITVLTLTVTGNHGQCQRQCAQEGGAIHEGHSKPCWLRVVWPALGA
mmetsp:Transcript_67745/g.148684  ORF Transcript_67745/g.148684 Transcript_67745/m.148684 type:complete len:301 (+) Transcript_67745:842-1744(+)